MTKDDLKEFLRQSGIVVSRDAIGPVDVLGGKARIIMTVRAKTPTEFLQHLKENGTTNVSLYKLFPGVVRYAGWA